MKKQVYTLRADVWIYQMHTASGRAREAPGAWYFVKVPKKQSAEIKERFRRGKGVPRGFGSIRVSVTVGGTTWHTSIFPDSKSGTYVLPIKAAVRKKEKIKNGDTIQLSLLVRE